MISNRTKLYCKRFEEIENYQLAESDDTQIYSCHHRLETHFSDGTERPKDSQLTEDELKALDMYWNRPPEELILVTKAQHNTLHFGGKTNPHNEATRKKMSEASKGKHLSEESKRKMSSTMRTLKWFTNGETSVRAKECPEGFWKGRR